MNIRPPFNNNITIYWKSRSQAYRLISLTITAVICISIVFLLVQTSFLDSDLASPSSAATVSAGLKPAPSATPTVAPTTLQPSPQAVIAPTSLPTIAPTKVARAGYIYSIKTSQPVVFLTIDDGEFKAPEAAELMRSKGLVASLFLTYTYIKDNPAYFMNLKEQTGSVIEAHTYSHPNLQLLTYTQQRENIQTGLDKLTLLYGTRPTLFRPPYGNFNENTRTAVGSLGIKTMVLWDVTINNGVLAYAQGSTLREGDIVLMHFRSTFAKDITAFAQEMAAHGFHTELLENWIQ